MFWRKHPWITPTFWRRLGFGSQELTRGSLIVKSPVSMGKEIARLTPHTKAQTDEAIDHCQKGI